jgi:hypothetical protein
MRDDSFPDTAATANNNKLSITTDMALRQGAGALDILNIGPPGRKRSTLQASLPAGCLKELRLLAEYHLLCFVQTPFEFVFSGDRATEGPDYGLARNWRTEP